MALQHQTAQRTHSSQHPGHARQFLFLPSSRKVILWFGCTSFLIILCNVCLRHRTHRCWTSCPKTSPDVASPTPPSTTSEWVQIHSCAKRSGCGRFVLTSLSFLFMPSVVCYPGAHAGADVQTQDVQSESQRLPEDVSVSEVAEDGRSSRSALFLLCSAFHLK